VKHSPWLARSAIVPDPALAPPRLPVDLDGLYRAHASTVARWAARLGGPGFDVDDVVQEVFLVARRKLQTWESGDAQITTWLFRVTNHIVQSIRRRQRLRRLFLRDDAGAETRDLSPRPTPLETLERRERVAQLYRLLERLPENQRRALILFELEGLSTQEIAELTGAPVATVRVWLHRGRMRFARLFADTGGSSAGEQGS
jgi:RNA polymerase sigma-70 factor (ECF subfamily)